MGCRDWGSGRGKAVQGRGRGCRVWGGHSLLLSDLHDLQSPPLQPSEGPGGTKVLGRSKL